MSSRAIHLSGRRMIAAFRTARSGPASESGVKPGAAVQQSPGGEVAAQSCPACHQQDQTKSYMQ